MLGTLWVFGNGWVYGAVVTTVVPATLLALSGWLTGAGRRHDTTGDGPGRAADGA